MIESEPGRIRRRMLVIPIAILLGGLSLFVGLNPGFRSEFRVVWGLLLGGDPDPLRDWLLGFGAWAPVMSGLLQVLTSLIPVLPGFVLAIANAMLYGVLLGGLLTFVTALLAAAACFGLARWMGRPGVERVVSEEALARVDDFMERRGIFAVFLGRLIPFINPDVLSYAAGATRMGWFPFLVAMAAGAVPATIFYSVVGGMAVESTLRVIALVAVAAILPLLLLAAFQGPIRRRATGRKRAGAGEDEPRSAASADGR